MYRAIITGNELFNETPIDYLNLIMSFNDKPKEFYMNQFNEVIDEINKIFDRTENEYNDLNEWMLFKYNLYFINDIIIEHRKKVNNIYFENGMKNSNILILYKNIIRFDETISLLESLYSDSQFFDIKFCPSMLNLIIRSNNKHNYRINIDKDTNYYEYDESDSDSDSYEMKIPNKQVKKGYAFFNKFNFQLNLS